jgi:hypothetical protein
MLKLLRRFMASFGMTERLFRWCGARSDGVGQGMSISSYFSIWNPTTVQKSGILGFGKRKVLILCDRMSRPSLVKIALSV